MDIETRIADLIWRMTLEEKVKQMDMYSVRDLVVEGRLSVARAENALNGMGKEGPSRF